MSTPHNEAKKGDIAERILLPGDPLRAKHIAETFLTDVKQFNSVRNMFGYTGKYKGEEVSVMGTGMGIPSIAIYTYELINNYGVKELIRVGSCGAMQEDMELYDVVLAMGANTNSNYYKNFDLPGIYSATCSYDLLEGAKQAADNKGIHTVVGNVLSSDIFYNVRKDINKRWAKMGTLAVEMEAYGLYANAQYYGAKALAILTVSDSIYHDTITTPEEREKNFNEMVEIALEA